MTLPLESMLVVDLSSDIPGGYCTKMLTDGGAEVVKLEPPEGDRLRRWSLSGTVAPDDDGPLFQFLACSKQSVVIDPSHDDVHRASTLLRAADVIVWSPGSRLAEHATLRPHALRELAPAAVVAAITSFGLTGPWAGRPATDITLQAWAGAIADRGSPERPPVHCGGRPGLWLAGAVAATGVLTSHLRAQATGHGELLDVSILETLTLMMGMYPVTRKSMEATVAGGDARPPSTATRSVTIPATERARDGWVGFMVATATMWDSFCVMVGHPEWTEDESTYAYAGRARRRPELESAIRRWVAERTVSEVLEIAALLRVPAAPLGNGSNVTTLDHLVEQGFYRPNPRSGFLQPEVPYTLGASARRRPLAPAPRLGQHSDLARVARAPRPLPVTRAPSEPARLPFEGMRVADFTAFWAGPFVGHYLAMLGADVIHVEAPNRPDGIRAHTIKTVADDQWWEYAPMFHGPNTNKRGVTIDMADERGRRLARRLITECDVMLENYSPRVVDQWGLDYDTVKSLRPDLIFVRMPAFGLSGPWRDRTGYAQNMEQVSGMAWMTGFPDGPPVVPNGVCDPLAGTHALSALLLALEHRRRTGEGMQVEVAMLGGALNVTAEQAIEYQVNGHLMERAGNRGPGAPQNLYLTNDVDAAGRRDCWVAIAVEDDDQWGGLRRAVGNLPWATNPRLATGVGRRAALDEIDKHLAAWCEQRSADGIVETLWAAGVPVGKVMSPSDTDHVEQHQRRGFFERVAHPLTGEALHVGFPVHFSGGPERFHRAPAPMLGQHNHEVFTGVLGMSADEVAELERDGVIGNRLVGPHRAR